MKLLYYDFDFGQVPFPCDEYDYFHCYISLMGNFVHRWSESYPDYYKAKYFGLEFKLIIKLTQTEPLFNELIMIIESYSFFNLDELSINGYQDDCIELYKNMVTHNKDTIKTLRCEEYKFFSFYYKNNVPEKIVSSIIYIIRNDPMVGEYIYPYIEAYLKYKFHKILSSTDMEIFQNFFGIYEIIDFKLIDSLYETFFSYISDIFSVTIEEKELLNQSFISIYKMSITMDKVIQCDVEPPADMDYVGMKMHVMLDIFPIIFAAKLKNMKDNEQFVKLIIYYAEFLLEQPTMHLSNEPTTDYLLSFFKILSKVIKLQNEDLYDIIYDLAQEFGLFLENYPFFLEKLSEEEPEFFEEIMHVLYPPEEE